MEFSHYIHERFWSLRLSMRLSVRPSVCPLASNGTAEKEDFSPRDASYYPPELVFLLQILP